MLNFKYLCSKMSSKSFHYNYYVIVLLLCFALIECTSENQFNPDKYYPLINQAELAVTEENYEQALNQYQEAFKYTVKPFGKDAYNAALTAAISGKTELRDTYLQLIINNCDDLIYLRSQFVDQYLKPGEWDKMILSRKMDYDPDLRDEMTEILEQDQLFRPDYDNYDDTINQNRIINMDKILNMTDKAGYPSHYEIGYQPRLKSQQHDIVLHHTAQRRSKDKTVTDLEPILKKAVQQGRFDPEQAILYMWFQNDVEKGRFETCNTWQYRHPALPDSLNSKIWIPKLTKEDIEKANAIRSQWHANTIEDIMTKTLFITQSIHPFKFSSVSNSIANFPKDISLEEALLQYQAFTSMRQEFRTAGM